MEELKQESTEQYEGGVVGEDGKITFTQEDLDALLQKSGDRRVSAALKTAEKKNADKIKEAQKLAQMSEQQRYEHELQQREEAIAEKERALALAENTNVASKILSEKGLSLSLVDLVIAEDAETMNQRITKLEKAFKSSVRAEVEKRLSTNSVPQSVTGDVNAMTKENFKKLSLIEKQQLFRSDPELYNSLSK